MTATVFISFASQDRKVALTLCSVLESRGFKCWISARDIQPGENFQVAIVQAIRHAKIMLLVFTANSNNSQEMTKELALASQQKLMVVPLRIEDVTPNDAFAYEFATRQWIDFFADWEFAIDQLSRRIGLAIGEPAAPSPAPNAAPNAAEAEDPAAPIRLSIAPEPRRAGRQDAAAALPTVALKADEPDRPAVAEEPEAAPAQAPVARSRTRAHVERPEPVFEPAIEAAANDEDMPPPRKRGMGLGLAAAIVVVLIGLGLGAPMLLKAKPGPKPEAPAVAALRPAEAAPIAQAAVALAAPAAAEPDPALAENVTAAADILAPAPVRRKAVSKATTRHAESKLPY